MDDPRRKRFQPYLRDLADRMGLKDWKVFVSNETPGSDTAEASTFLAYGQKLLRVMLPEKFLDRPPEDQRAILVHELIHAHLEMAWETAIDVIPDGSRPGFIRLMEYGIDGMAIAWSETLPLP